MDTDGAEPRHLTRSQCLVLMATVEIGRIVYTRQALPAVEVVNFVLDHGDIVIGTDAGGQLAGATRGAVVAFEADSLDSGWHSGWSVTVVGQCQAVTGLPDIERLREAGLAPCGPGEREYFIRIPPGIVSGRRLAAGQAKVPGHAHTG